MNSKIPQILIASAKSREFEQQFNLADHNLIHFFSNGGDALTFWKRTQWSPPAFVFLDYAAMSDNEPGLRISKQIRDLEKQWNVAETCKIYLMADQPNPMSEISAGRNGATGLIKKNCSEIIETINKVKADASRANTNNNANGEDDIKQELSPDLLQRIEAVKNILRRFIGAAATKVGEDARALLLKGELEASEQAYILYLASRIPTDEMQAGFLSTVRK